MIKDGIVLFYIMNGELYPVALTEQQAQLLPAAVSVLGEIKVIGDKPQGKVTDLLDRKRVQ